MTILQAQEIVKRTQYGPSGKKKGQLFLHDFLRDVIPHSPFGGFRLQPRGNYDNLHSNRGGKGKK